MEFQVAIVLGLVDPLETANEVFMNVFGEWLRSLDLVVGGSMEVKDPSRSGNDLTIERKVKREEGEIRWAIIVTHVRLFDWVDLK